MENTLINLSTFKAGQQVNIIIVPSKGGEHIDQHTMCRHSGEGDMPTLLFHSKMENTLTESGNTLKQLTGRHIEEFHVH